MKLRYWLLLIAVFAGFGGYFLSKEFPEFGGWITNAWIIASTTIINWVTFNWITGGVTVGLTVGLLALILWKGYWKTVRFGFNKTMEPIRQTAPAFPTGQVLGVQPIQQVPVPTTVPVAPQTAIEEKKD